MTKTIILVKIFYKLSYVIQEVKNIFDEVTSWPQLHLPVCCFDLIGLALFYTQGVFVGLYIMYRHQNCSYKLMYICVCTYV